MKLKRLLPSTLSIKQNDMETQNIETKQIYNLTETPWYFGAYLNMARHNVYLLINHLTEKFSYLEYEKINDDKQVTDKTHILANIFDTSQKINDDERFKVYKYLVKRHYLPFIKIFHQENGYKLDVNPIVDYDALHSFLINIFDLINEFRNSYSHFLAINDDGKIIKDRKQDVPEKVKEIILLIFNNAPDFSLKRFEQKQQEEDYKHLDFYQLFEENSTKLTEHGFYFIINLFLERSYAIKFLKKISGFKNETIPSFRATIQVFTAYSLRVPDVRLDNDDRKQSLLLEMLNELQRCPKELYNHLTKEDKKKFEPPINEMGKNNILLNSTNYQNIKDEDIDNLLSEITTLKRNSNRFAYFALRFIDEFNLLPNIRFQIKLGKLHTNNYEKTILKVNSNRRILKTVNTYGKLSDFENKETEVLSLLKKGFENNEKVYFEQYAPHYNMENNKIPFYIFETTDDKIKYPNPLTNKKEDGILHNKPTGFISLNDLPKLVLLAYFNFKDAEKLIVGYITKNNELILNQEQLEQIKEKLSLIPEEFTRRIAKEKLLLGKDKKTNFLNKQIETNLLSKYKNLFQLESNEIKREIKNKKEKEYVDQIRYNNYLSERRKELQKHLPSGILVNQLPTQIINYLLNISEANANKVIHQKIKTIKEDSKRRVKRIQKEILKDKEEQNLKLGELATFLARDFIDMVIEEGVKKKITSPYYNKLQNKIAYFSISKNEIIELCDELSLFDKNKGHVFLLKELINESKGITEFYENYLNAKIKWIEDNLFIKGKTGGYIIPDGNEIPLSYSKIASKIKNKDFTNWLTNKSKMPVDLPNSLFNNAIEKQLSQRLYQKKIQFDEGDKFSIRLSKLLNGDIQPFYKFKRVYKLNNESIEFDISNLDGKEIKSKYGKYAESNEKTIRFIQTQDRILKLLCENILSESNKFETNEGFNLSSIFPFSESSPLNRPAKFKQKIIRKGNENYFTVIAEDNEFQIKEIEVYKQLITEEEKANYNGQKGYEWSIKDFGRFKRMVNDRRIKNLSAYFENEEVTFDFLQYQLKEYDKYREKVFKQTFDLEELISEKAFEEIKNIELKKREDEGKEFNEIQFDVFVDLMVNNGLLSEIEIEQLKKIRGRFSHSEFPDYYPNIVKLTKTDNENFESNKKKKGEVEKLSLSISKKVFDVYCELTKTIN